MGSSQRSFGLKVVMSSLHENKWCVLCMWVLQSGQYGVGCVSGDILFMYWYRRGDLFARSCESVRLMLLGSVSSVALMGGAMVFSTLLCLLSMRYFSVVCVCMALVFSFIVSVVVSFGGVSRFVV